MNPKTAIARLEPQPQGLVLRDMASLKQFCEIAVAAGIGGKGDPKEAIAQAIIKVQAGAELGLGPMQSLMSLMVVQGNPALRAHGMASAIKRHPRYDYRIVELTNQRCEIEFFADRDSVGRSSFDMAQAREAGLGGKNWKAYPQNMLFARAISNGFRWYCPDAINGAMYTAEEFAEFTSAETEDIDAVDPVTGEVSDPIGSVPSALQSAPLITDNQLKALFACAREHNVTGETLKAYNASRFNHQSRKELTRDEASRFIDAIRNGDVTAWYENTHEARV